MRPHQLPRQQHPNPYLRRPAHPYSRNEPPRPLSPVRELRRDDHPVHRVRDPRHDPRAHAERARGVRGGYGVDVSDPARVPTVPAAAASPEAELLPAQKEPERSAQEAVPAAGRDSAANAGAGADAPLRPADADENAASLVSSWESLLETIRSGAERAAAAVGDRAPCRRNADNVVAVQPADRVLRPQVVRTPFKSHWVVNTDDWLDVEHTVRRMMRCETSECYAFSSIGYIFFRSCAVSHVAMPSEFLKPGFKYRFPESEITIEIVQACPEQGVLEVEVFFEYTP